MIRSSLTARVRGGTGKEVAKKVRQQGMIPAVLYGPKTNPMNLMLDPEELLKAISTEAGENTLIDLSIEGEKDRVVLLRELQIDPVSRQHLHADLYEVPLDKKITVPVPIHLLGTPVGVKEGGILDQIRREIPVSCLPTEIPEHIDIDVSELKIHGTIHIKDLTFPEGVESEEEDELTVATVLAPRIEEIPVAAPVEEGAEAAAPAEGEKAETEKAKEDKDAEKEKK